MNSMDQIFKDAQDAWAIEMARLAEQAKAEAEAEAVAKAVRLKELLESSGIPLAVYPYASLVPHTDGIRIDIPRLATFYGELDTETVVPNWVFYYYRNGSIQPSDFECSFLLILGRFLAEGDSDMTQDIPE